MRPTHPTTAVSLTRWQRANLAKLAAYLRTLPKDYPDFEMRSFTRDGEGHGDDRAHKPVCGTAACAAGHGPRAGVRPRPGETWESYSERAFADYGNAWMWVFSGGWADVDNTVHGAAARIEFMLENGVPDGWHRLSDEKPYLPVYADRIDAVQS